MMFLIHHMHFLHCVEKSSDVCQKKGFGVDFKRKCKALNSTEKCSIQEVLECHFKI